MIIVLLQSLGFREDFASTYALSAEVKLHAIIWELLRVS